MGIQYFSGIDDAGADDDRDKRQDGSEGGLLAKDEVGEDDGDGGNSATNHLRIELGREAYLDKGEGAVGETGVAEGDIGGKDEAHEEKGLVSLTGDWFSLVAGLDGEEEEGADEGHDHVDESNAHGIRSFHSGEEGLVQNGY